MLGIKLNCYISKIKRCFYNTVLIHTQNVMLKPQELQKPSVDQSCN